jgi:EmrB/QacA subfamily drug resistance transporter
MIMVALAAAILLAALDQTVVATALPTIAGQLGSLTGISLIVTAYLVASAVATPVAGKCGDLYGRRPVFIVAILVFGAGSLCGGFAQTLWQLVGARGVQGAGGGAMMTVALAIVAESVPDRYRPRYQGFLGSVFGIASIIGPLVGGFLTEHASWRWAFFINVPFCAVIIAGVRAAVPPSARRPSSRLDVPGILLLGTALVGILLTLDWGGTRYSWASPVTLALAAASVVLVVGFVAVEHRAAQPLMPLRLFAHRRLVAPLAAGALMAMTLFVAVTYLPTFFQYALRLNPTRAGLILMPFMLTVVAASSAAGTLASRWNMYRWFPRVGTVLGALGMVSFTLIGDGAPIAQAVASVVLFGLGLGMTMQLIVVAAQDAVPAADLGVGTGLVMLARSVGAVLGVAAWGTVFAQLYSHAAGTVPGLPDAAAVTPTDLGKLPAATAAAVASAISDSLRTVFLWATIPAVLAALATFGIREKHMTTEKESV